MRRMVRFARATRVLGALGALGASMHACAAPPAPAPVRVGYFANLTHAQGVLGVASGDFAKAIAPAPLETRVFNAGPALIEALFAGEIDIGYVGPGPALNAFAQSRGEGIRVLAGAAANGVVLVAGPNSGIARVEDLKGKRIATPQIGNTQDISARHFVTSVLKQADSNNVLPIPNAEQSAMMARGQIDAAWAVEPWAARLEAEAGARVIAEEKDLWPGGEFTLTLVVVSPKFLEKRPEAVEALLRAHCAWTAKLVSDPNGHVPALTDALQALTGKRLSQDVISRAISRVKFTDEPLESSLATFAQWTYDLGHAKKPIKIAGLVDKRLLEKARAALAPSSPTSAPAEPRR